MPNVYLTILFAFIFYYIGNHDYNQKGVVLGLASVALSLIGASYSIWYGFIGANVLFYLGIMVYNVVAKPPKTPKSGR
jgi:hypothetical protein